MQGTSARARSLQSTGLLRMHAMSDSYRLRHGESIARGLTRLVTKELKSAIDQLGESEGREGAIHETRKSVKKVRAALRLIRKGAPDVTDRDRQRLRRSGRLLSPVRNTEALLQTARDLCRDDLGTREKEMCAALHRHLAANKARAFQPSTLALITTQALDALRSVRRSSKYWNLRAARFPLVARGLKRVYRDARTAMPGRRERDDDVALHRWRRRVKTLWYNLRLFEERMPMVKRLTEDLEHLETWLGEDHNLVLLREQIHAVPDEPSSELARLAALAGRRQGELRHAALSLGSRLFAARPRDFLDDLYLWRRMSRHAAPSRIFRTARRRVG
jgi:CHAD domain-containing protein